MEITKEELTSFKELLSEYKDLDPIPNSLPTIFEISGYPHYEDVISNVLQFFFRSDYEHGFASLFVESLLNTVDGIENIELDSVFEVQEVEREVMTNKGNRIDIVIETETVCVAIENKIYHHLQDNDLQDYQKYITEKYPDHNKIFLVLSLRDIEKPKNWDKNEFTLVTYDQFFDALEANLGSALLHADTKYTLYLSDLIKTLRNMSKKTQLTPEFLDFLGKNRSDIESLFQNGFKKFKDECCSKANQIEELIEYEGTGFRSYQFNPSDELKYVKVFEKIIKEGGTDFKLQIKLRFNPSKWYLEVWSHKEKEIKAFQNLINDKLDKAYAEWESHSESEAGSIIYEEFEYGEAPDEVADKLSELICKFT